MTLSKSDKVFVAGHNGLVGSAIVDVLKKKGYERIVTRSRKELDLRNSEAVNDFYKKEKPDAVFVAAAKVGGIHANNTFRADFIYENLVIQNNLIWGAHTHDVRRLIFLGSSCIYPRNAPQPMPETCLLQSELEYTNRPYALAKIAGLELIHGLRMQYGRDYFSAMPTNLYGPRDNFHPENSHVLPALIRRFCENVDAGSKEITIWGTGSPKREFMHSHDCADAVVFLAEKLTKDALESSSVGKAKWSHVNVGSGQEVSIRELAEIVSRTTKFQGKLVFDSSRPDGTPRKLLDSSFLNSLGWSASVPLERGIQEAVSWFRENVR